MRSPGPIALLGGGEHLGPTAPLDRRLIELSGTTRPVVVILPQAPAKGQLAKTVALARNYWARMGTDVRIAVPELDPVRAELALMEADIAVIPGGHPNKLIGGLGVSPLTDLIITRWLDGMAISGSSAGAMGLFEWRIKLYPPNPLRLLPALGLLDGYVAAPHFDRFKAAQWAHRAVNGLNGLAVLGLDEATGIVGYNLDFEVFGKGTATVVTSDATTSYPRRAQVQIDLLAGSRMRLAAQFERSTASLPEAFESLPTVLAVNGSKR
jgi:peptidase E